MIEGSPSLTVAERNVLLQAYFHPGTDLIHPFVTDETRKAIRALLVEGLLSGHQFEAQITEAGKTRLKAEAGPIVAQAEQFQRA